MHINYISTEENFDFVQIYNSRGDVVSSFSGILGNTSLGANVWNSTWFRIRFASDAKAVSTGFRLNFSLSMTNLIYSKQ